MTGAAGVERVYVTAGTRVDASNLGLGDDIVYLTGNLDDYVQTINQETGVYTFTRTDPLSGKLEEVKFTVSDQNDVVYFRNGHIVINAVEDARLYDPNLAEPFQKIQSAWLTFPGTPLENLIAITSISDDTGQPNDFITTDKEIVLHGTSNAADGVRVELGLGTKGQPGYQSLGFTTVTNGEWSFNQTLNIGEYNFSAYLLDFSDEVAATDTQLVKIQNTDFIVEIKAINRDSGEPGDFVTNDNARDGSFEIGGDSNAPPGTTVQIFLDNNLIGTTTVQAPGVWSYTYTTLPTETIAEGDRTFTVKLVDSQNAVFATDSRIVTIDTNPDTAGDIFLTAISTDSGINTDFITNDNDGLTVSGTSTAADGSHVEIRVNGAIVDYTTVNGGVWSYNYAVGMADGDYTFTANLVDLAGNISDSAEQIVTIDTNTIDPPSKGIVVGSLRISADTGVSDSDFITMDNDGLTISATLSAPLLSTERLQYTKDGGLTWTNVAAGTVVENGAGGPLTKIVLVDNSLTTDTTIGFRVTNVVGKGTETLQAIDIDTTPPAAADVFITSITDDSGVSPTDFVTNDNQLVIRGACAADGNYIAVKLDDEVIGYAMVTGGEWSLNYLDIIPDGAHKIGADLVDLAGNVAASAMDKPLVIDTSAKNDEKGNPDPIDGKYITVDGVTIDSGVYSNDFVTKENQLIFRGESDAPEGSHVAVKLNGNIIGYTTVVKVNGSGVWSFNYTGTTLTDGDYTLDADLVDLAGNVAATAVDKALVIDTSATTDEHGNPDPIAGKSVTITAISDDTGVLNNDFITKDNAQDGNFVISGTSTASINSYIEVRLGGNILGYTTVIDDQGHWSYTYTPSAPIADNDAHLFTANLVDVAGNIAAFDDQSVKIDTLAPTLISSSPADNDEFIAPATDIVLTFSENITAGSGNIVIANATGTDVRTININDPGLDEIIIKDNTLTINLKDDLLELNSYHVTVTPGAIKDIAGNPYAGITDPDVLNFSTYPAVIDLGALGQLISPIQVDGGNWYYHYDYNKNFYADAGDGVNNIGDNVSHNFLDGIFKYAGDFVTENVRPDGRTDIPADTTDQYRFAALQTVSLSSKIVNLALPTLGASYESSLPVADGSYLRYYSSTATGSPSPNEKLGSRALNEAYDDILAIWDAYNGTENVGGIDTSFTTVPRWGGTGSAFAYWTATQIQKDKHAAVFWDGAIYSGGSSDVSSGSGLYATAVQILNGPAPVVQNIAITADSEAVYSSLNEGDEVTITVTMSEVVVVTGSPTLNLNIGGSTVQAQYQSGDRTNQLTFTYQIQADQNDADGISIDANSIKLNGGKIRDVSGNNAILFHDAVISNPDYIVDNTPPTATIELSDYVLGVNETATVTIKFDGKVINFDSDKDVTVQNGFLSPMTSDVTGKIWTGTFTPTPGIEVANNVITLASSYQDLAGNNGTTATSGNYIIDGIAPTAPGQPAIAENADGFINAAEAADGTPAGTPVVVNIGGTGAIEKDSLRINWGSQQVNYTLLQTDIDAGSATVNVPQAIIALQGDGQFKVTAQIIDQRGSGNASSESHPTAVTVDTLAPAAIITMEDNSLTRGETTLVTITFSEKVTDFSNADVVVENGYLDGEMISDVTGKIWTGTFVPTSDINEISNHITLASTYKDLAGNEGTGAMSVTYRVYTVLSSAPIIGSVTDDVDPVAGKIIDGGYTNDTELVLRVELADSGAVDGDRIRLYNGMTQLGSDVILNPGNIGNIGNGYVYIPTPALNNGDTYVFSVTRINQIGNIESAASPGYTVIIDTTAPVAGTLSFSGLTDNGSADPTPITTDDIFDLTLSGASDANSYTEVYQQNLNDTGWTNLTSKSLSGLADGSYKFRAKVTDPAGNSSTTNVISVIVDKTAAFITQNLATVPVIPVKLEATGVTTGSDSNPQITAVGSSGECVVTWHGVDENGDSSIYVQKFNADGTTTGNTPVKLEATGVTTGFDGDPIVTAVGSTGAYVVAWTGYDGADNSIYVQKFNADGTTTGNTPVKLEATGVTTGNDYPPQITAVGSVGEYVVTWYGLDDNGDNSIYVQKFNADGTTAGNTPVKLEATGVTTGSDIVPQITAVGSAGEYVVTWSGYDGADNSIYVQKFNADGTTAGNTPVKLEATGVTTGADQNPQITAVGSVGEYVVTWYGLDDNGDNSIYVQKFNADGTIRGNQVKLEATGVTTGADFNPQVTAVGSSGEFVVTWEGVDENGDDSIYVQKFNVNGTIVGSVPVKLEATGVTTGADLDPQVTAVGNTGEYVVTWSGDAPSGFDDV